jgi:phage baseplate assembly protein W
MAGSRRPVRRTASARVTLTIEVSVGAWGDKCELAQVYQQAEVEARHHVETAFRKEKRARIVGRAKVEAIITTVEDL